VSKRRAHSPAVVRNELGDALNLVDICTLGSKVPRSLVHEARARQPAPADQRPLLAGHSNVVTDNQEAHAVVRRLACKAKVEHITSVLLDDHKRALVVLDELERAANLAGVGRREDVAADSRRQRVGADKAGV
jgi:hypothetical protein